MSVETYFNGLKICVIGRTITGVSWDNDQFILLLDTGTRVILDVINGQLDVAWEYPAGTPSDHHALLISDSPNSPKP